MKISNRVRNGFLVGCVALGAVLLWANLRKQANPTEATFFTGKEKAMDRDWPQTPLRISYSREVGDRWKAQLVEAVDSINRDVGCTVLDFGSPATIRVVTPIEVSCGDGQEVTGNTGVITYFCKHGGVDMVAWNLVHNRQAYVAFEHEFAHAFGIAHDPSGLMAQDLQDDMWSRTDVPLPTLSHADAKALNRRYCKRGAPDAK